MNKSYIALGTGTAALIIFAVLVFKFWLLAANIAGGFLLYFIIDGFLEWLERKGIRGFWAYAVLTLVSAIVLTSFILFVSIPLVEQTKELITQLPGIAEQVNHLIMDYQDAFPFLLDAQETAKQRLIQSAEGIFNISKEIVTSILTILLITLILLASRGTLHQKFTESIPNDYFEVTVGLMHRIVENVENYANAKIIETIIMIALHFVGFWAIGLPHALILSMLSGILNIIPYIGPLIGVAPVGLVAFLAGGYPLLALSIMIIVIAQAIDNTVLQTWLISKFVDIHPLMVAIITIIAGETAGVVGMVIAIPVYTVAKIIISGMYDYLKSVQRHEKILRDEERYQQSYAGKRKIKTHIFSAH